MSIDSMQQVPATGTYLFGRAGNRLYDLVGYLALMIERHGDGIELNLQERRYHVEDDLTEVVVAGSEWYRFMREQPGWRLLT